MDRLTAGLRAHAGAMDASVGQPRFGIVQSVDPNSYTVRVLLQPENTLSGWLPVLSQWVGAGWGLSALPSPGHHVLVLPQEGHIDHGVVVGRLFIPGVTAPPVDASSKPAPAGELWLVHASGAKVRLGNDASIAITGGAPNGAMNITLNGTGIFALVAATIQLGATGETLHKLMNDVAMALFNTHTHGGGPAPDQQMTAGTHTTSALSAG